ncbi:MAG TPA: LPS assembly protein LptD [Rhizomicrobium sp.]|nr:LPS assembly protein LptD [Rhizomicrobium sp.]
MRRPKLPGLLTAMLLLGGAAAHAASDFSGKDALLGPPGGDYVLKADDVTYDVNGKVVTASGHVEVDHNGRIVTTDLLTYDQNTDTLVATGNVVMMAPDGTVIFSPRATLSNEMKDGVLEGFRALIGKTGRLSAVEARRKDGTVTTLDRAVFTHCKICNKPGQRTPLWDVKAYHVVYDQTAHKITYRDAVIDLFGIPVAWTPYFSQSDPTVKRETGLLAPDVGSSSTLGTFVKLPYYISFNDSRDMTIEPIFSTEGGEVLEGEYRERWDNGGMWLQGSIANNPNGGLKENQNQTYSSLFGSGRTQVGDSSVWRFGYDVQLTSNPTYLERYSLYNKDDQLFNDLFVQGVSGRSRFAITGYFFQSLVGACPVLTTVNPPVCATTQISPLFIKTAQIPLVLPLIEYTYIPERPILGGDFRFDINSASIERHVGPDDQRLTAEMRWQLPLVTNNGQVITLRADVRGDLYHVTNNDLADPNFPALFLNVPAGSHYISRGLPYIGLDWRWPFIAGGGAGKPAFVVEPIIQAIAAPYGGNPKGIPNEGSYNIELGENDVFSFDRLPGYDIAESGPRANVGFRTEALFPKGSVEVQIGEVLRLKPDPVFAQETGFADKASDVVGRFTIKFPPYLSLTHRVDVDQSSGTVRRNQVYLDGNYGRSSIELSYVRLPQQDVINTDEPREEVNGQATLGVFGYWVVFAAARRDLASSQMLDDEFGVGYDDECLKISLSYRRQYTRDRDIPPSTSILFRFKLNTEDEPETQGLSELFPRHLFSSTSL